MKIEDIDIGMKVFVPKLRYEQYTVIGTPRRLGQAGYAVKCKDVNGNETMLSCSSLVNKILLPKYCKSYIEFY